ncbi:MAG: phytanoyl-CoA dioxygenase family protein [Deltaproteobacteria bacterium]|jgi:ectoine hydroxylase-related dioxygenase (phytanoyl-CoA dioxygenase family)|nr:phytanoyl-CoA dioxygenase family protein [Deltaproteobacteria bacterium]|tara:strand:+ start:492 stop:1355 length:864 start_codon:yes stop_codon:yes gene_type:complete
MYIGNPESLKHDYEKQGFILVENLFDETHVIELQRVTEELIEQSRGHQKSDEKFDLEPDHSQANPRVQRIKVPHKQHKVFAKALRNSMLLNVLQILIGNNVRFRNSKLNIKAAKGGSEVDWHQDWAFYPHTNSDLLAVGIMLDDIDEDNAPLMVVPQSHLGKTLNHHYRGVFSGAVDLKEEKVDYSTSYKITGKAGSTSFHHVKALHGSGPNQSDRPRRMLFFEYAAADAWPLVDFEAYGDFAEYEEKMVLGKSTLQPRTDNSDIIIPYPRPPNADSIYRMQEFRRA